MAQFAHIEPWGKHRYSHINRYVNANTAKSIYFAFLPEYPITSTRSPVTSLHTYFREILGTRKKITRLVNYVFQKVRLEKLVKLVFQEFRVISLNVPENTALLVVRARRAPVYRDLNGFL